MERPLLLFAPGARRAPDRLPVLLTAHAQALMSARRGSSGPVLLVGKSMGSRVGCHLALQEAVAGLVCLGYPLRGASGALRDQVLLDVRTPVLFVQGTRDRLCPLDELARVRTRMAAPSELHRVEGGDHSLQVGVRELRSSGRTQDGEDEQVFGAIRTFLQRVLGSETA
jgi:predicted alpha/beta-hydrolase family hydrolase